MAAPLASAYMTSEQKELEGLTAGAGDQPTMDQFWTAVDFVMEKRPNSADALEFVVQLRQTNGMDNQLLACLDHYFFTKKMAGWGLPCKAIKAGNAGYSLWKAACIPVPGVTSARPAPQTWIQYRAGVIGTDDGRCHTTHMPEWLRFLIDVLDAAEPGL